MFTRDKEANAAAPVTWPRATLCVRGCGVWSSCLLHWSETQSYFKTAVCALPGEVTYPVAVGEKSLELPLYRDVTFVTTALS